MDQPEDQIRQEPQPKILHQDHLWNKIPKVVDKNHQDRLWNKIPKVLEVLDKAHQEELNPLINLQKQIQTKVQVEKVDNNHHLSKVKILEKAQILQIKMGLPKEAKDKIHRQDQTVPKIEEKVQVVFRTNHLLRIKNLEAHKVERSDIWFSTRKTHFLNINKIIKS